MRSTALALAVGALAGAAALVAAAPAAAKAPCWSRVINDWYDNGRIDGTYPVACYREALQHLPEDVQQYADAHDVITRAMQAAIAAGAKKNNGKPGGGNGNPQGSTTSSTTTAPTTSTSTGPQGQTQTNSSSSPPPGGNTTQGPPPEHKDPPLQVALKKIGPSDANSIPLPLVILGVLALLLLAAGAAGLVARKLQERRALATPGGTPPAEPPKPAS